MKVIYYRLIVKYSELTFIQKSETILKLVGKVIRLQSTINVLLFLVGAIFNHILNCRKSRLNG